MNRAETALRAGGTAGIALITAGFIIDKSPSEGGLVLAGLVVLLITAVSAWLVAAKEIADGPILEAASPQASREISPPDQDQTRETPFNSALIISMLAVAGAATIGAGPQTEQGKGLVAIVMIGVLVITTFLAELPRSRYRLNTMAALLTIVALCSFATVGYRLAVSTPTVGTWMVALMAVVAGYVLLKTAVDLRRDLASQRQEQTPAAALWPAEMLGPVLIALTFIIIAGMILYKLFTTTPTQDERLHAETAARGGDVVYQPLPTGVRSNGTSAHLTLAEIQHLDDALRGQPALRDRARHLLDTQGYITQAQAEELNAAYAEVVKAGLFRNVGP